MPKYLIIYTKDGKTDSVTFEHSENVGPHCSFLRDLDYQYEVYIYDAGMGYIRTTRFPAA